MARRTIIAAFLSLSISAWGLVAAETPEDIPAVAGEVSSPPAGNNLERIRIAIRQAEDDRDRMKTETKDTAEGWSIGNILSVAALAVALFLMWRTMCWTRGGGVFRAPGGREMSVLDRMAVGRQTTLLVVRLRGRDYWLADHPQGVTFLAEITSLADKPSSPETPSEPEDPESVP